MNCQKPLNLIFISLFLFIFLVSCTNNNLFEPKENILSQRKIKLKKEILFINIDSLTLHHYQYYQFYKNSEQHLFIGYNNKTHAFDLLDLKGKKILCHIFLDQNGPNAIHRVKGFYFHNFDTIFIYNYPYLSVLDSKSRVNDKIKIIPGDSAISDKKIATPIARGTARNIAKAVDMIEPIIAGKAPNFSRFGAHLLLVRKSKPKASIAGFAS